MQSCAQNVRFSRLIMTILIAYYALFTEVVALYVMLGLSFLTLILGHKHSLTSYVYKVLKLLKFDKLFSLNPRYQRSFEINRSMTLFEEGMRLSVGSMVLLMHLNGWFTAASALAFFMAIFMMISTFFGFCLSGLMYIGYRALLGKKSHAQ